MAADCITQTLARTGLVDVVPAVRVRESLRTPGNPGDTSHERIQPQTLAEDTGAGTVVSGAYYLDGENLRFQISVADAAEGKLICALPPIVGPRGAPMATVDAVCQRVAGVLATNYDPALDSSPPTIDAFRETIAGLDLWYVDWPGASDHFRRASELDSSYVLPALFRGPCLFVLQQRAKVDSIARSLSARRQKLTPYERLLLDANVALIHGREGEVLRHLRRIDALLEETAPDRHLDRLFMKRLKANTAIVLNRPQEALDTLESYRQVRDEWEPRFTASGVGWEIFAYRYECVARHMVGDHERELIVARRAHRLFPDHPLMRAWEISALAALGRVEEALAVVDDCVDAPSGTRYQIGWRHPCPMLLQAAGELRAHGHREASLAVANRGVEFYRGRPASEAGTAVHRSDLALLLYAAERWDETRELLETLAAEHPDDTWYRSRLGRLAAREGRREDALAISEELEKITEPYSSGNPTYSLAEIAALLGDSERAVQLLQAALGEGCWMFHDAGLHWDMDLESLHGYPPFEEFLRPKG